MIHSPIHSRILNAAMTVPYKSSRAVYAKAANVAPTLINYYFGTMEKFFDEVIKKAVAQEVAHILVAASAAKDSRLVSVCPLLMNRLLDSFKQ